MKENCLLCNWPEADQYFQRIQVWENDLWRVTTSLVAPVPGYSYLEPKRHIPYITDLEGAESASLGPTLALVTRILHEVTNSELIYVNVFGERVVWHVLLDVTYHATQHRSEAAVLLTSYGQPPGDFDFTMFLNERTKGRSR